MTYMLFPIFGAAAASLGRLEQYLLVQRAARVSIKVVACGDFYSNEREVMSHIAICTYAW